MVDRITLEPRIVAWDLGAGETAVLSHSMRRRDAVCVVDDRAARDSAAVFGLKVAGSVGILLRAKRAGLMAAVRPEIAALLNAGAQLSKQVVHECLKLAGEGD